MSYYCCKAEFGQHEPTCPNFEDREASKAVIARKDADAMQAPPEAEGREPHDNPSHEYNSAKYHPGKLCVEGCGRPAGTAWSPLWCQPCNAARIDRISTALTGLAHSRREGGRCLTENA